MDYQKPDQMSLNESAEVGLQIAQIKDYNSNNGDKQLEQPTQENHEEIKQEDIKQEK